MSASMNMQDPMIAAADLAQLLGAPDLRVIDATWFGPGDPRSGRAAFLASHIPGAVFFDINEIADPTTDLPHMLPDPVMFSSRMRSLGLGDGHRFVVYDQTGVFAAARVWWMLRVMGAREVLVLDGGFPAWTAGHHPVEDGAVAPQERHFSARKRAELVRDYAQMRAHVAIGNATILDARPPARFSGAEAEPRPGLRRGAMPGAVNMPWTEVFAPDGRMKDAAALQAVFDGAEKAPTLIATCGSGVSACVLALALARLGRRDVAVYDGSWAEWGARAESPIVTRADD